MSLFGDLAGLAEELAGESGRLKKRAAIAAAIARVVGAREPGEGEDAGAFAAGLEPGWRERVEDAGRFALYLAGTPFAEADSRKLNAGGALLSKALLAVSGATDRALGAAYRRHGDMGAAAFDLLEGKAPAEATLTLMEVEDAFAAMAVARSTAVRAGLVEGLLRRATAIEAKYLLKLMLGDMRIGVKQSLVEEAVAVAAGEEGRAVEVGAVRHAVMLEADLGGAVVRAFEGTLGEARMRLFHPLGFMLASPVETPEEAVERFRAKPVKVAAVKKKGRGKKGVGAEEAGAGEAGLSTAAAPSVEMTGGAVGGSVEMTGGAVGGSVEMTGGSVGGSVAVVGVGGSELEAAHLSHDETVAKMGHPGLVEGEEVAGGGVEAFLEDKYDGMRAQVHCGDGAQPGRVAIYSRNREEVTESFPELEEAFRAVFKVAEAGRGVRDEAGRGVRDGSGPGVMDGSGHGVGDGGPGAVILDGEILGWDFATGQALPFAVLGQRIGRKRVTNEWRAKVPVVFMAFDLMYADGGLRLDLPLRERRSRLEAVVEAMSGEARSPLLRTEEKKAAQGLMFGEGAADKEVEEGLARLMISPSRLVETAEEIDRAYQEARARANEGVMLKAAGSAYLPGRRGLAWAKLKRELATLDVVITGAEFGSGRRAAFLSDYTFAVRDAGGDLKNVGKAYSGVTDAEIVELTEWLKEHTLEDFGHFRTVEPLIILEVAFNNVMRSDRHASGFALRFPRIVRIRTDKPVEEIDTVERVEEVYQSQVDKPVEVAVTEEAR